ncbi:hypothetical protein M408DRAFT_330848 [Serendipita vermifera MAFF 305830]|uniref:Uncharacterized protein n=1 Tax=Serendipita vermifera MAFF 305830 TaxID=933852 RepID=A0A0C2XA57_SERVB|nr:hypothetical protein M408DRAFT_330848 [Serendipita vermifera MAFF 305830]
MVSISFEPPLRVETRVRPAAQGDTTIKLTFHATLDLSEWRRIERNGASVELWSDIPAEGKASGHWGATQFTKVGLERNRVELEASVITLSSRGGSTPSRYCYTYRVRQANGDIQWLGNSSSNGSLVVESEAFWSPSEDSSSTTIGTIHWPTKWKGWIMSPEQAPAQLALLSLDPRESSPAAQTLLLVPGSTRKEVSTPPLLVVHSSNSPISVSHGKVYCETPEDVTVQAVQDGSSVAEVLQAHGITFIPTSTTDTFFVLSSPRAHGQASLSFHPIWLTPHIPTTVEISSSSIKLLAEASNPIVLYPPGQGFSQPIMMSEERHEIPLGNGSEPLRAILLHAMPNHTNQLVGIATPSNVHHRHPSPYLPSPTPTVVDPAEAGSTEQDHNLSSEQKVATVTVSKASNVLFARTVPIPNVVMSQMERLFRFKLLYTFYRLALYIVSLMIPLLGVNLSLKISPKGSPQESAKLKLPEPEKAVVSEKEQKLSNKPETSEDSTEDNSTLFYDVEPVSGEVHVSFLGDAADDVSFTVNGKGIDPWSVVQTWHGDNLHQFLLRMDTPTRLGISIQTATTQ